MGTRTASEGARRRKVSDLAAGLGRSGRQNCEASELGAARWVSGVPRTPWEAD